jgi:hypothetical protein
VAWVTRRSYVLGGAGLVAVAGAVAAVVVLVGSTGGGKPRTLAAPQYFARIQVICRRYDRKLARIAPPASLQLLPQSIGQTLPLVERQLAEERAVEPPPELATRVERVFALSDEAVRDLKQSRRKALAGDTGGAVTAFAKFIDQRDKARQAAEAIGFRC